MNGLRGTRSRDISRVREGNRAIGGTIRLQPSAVELAALLQWALYGTPSGAGTVTYPLADVPVQKYVTVDRGIEVITYNGCAVDSFTIRGSAGSPLDITLAIVGKDESEGNPGTFPALNIDTTTQPFIFTDLSFNINGDIEPVDNFTLTVNNAIDRGRFYNSQTLTDVIAMDRHVGLTFEAPFGTANQLYQYGAAGVQCVATFTGEGTSVLVLSMIKVAFARHTPSFVAGRSEERIPMRGVAYANGATKELVTTLHT